METFLRYTNYPSLQLRNLLLAAYSCPLIILNWVYELKFKHAISEDAKVGRKLTSGRLIRVYDFFRQEPIPEGVEF
ncbi:hypothetical protein SUGI_1191190 [Cryptomeria japonica]|nr:hypothetical protein SUGI_1191190 [Cryptomeria japonica]